MLSPQKVKLTCQNHNKDVVQICKSQKCKIYQKACCTICINNNAHMGCDLLLIEDIPQYVEDHKIQYKGIQNCIKLLEEEFQTKTRIMKEVLEGYQIEETFICISQLDHLNILANVFRKLPKVKEKMDEISKIITNILKELSSQKLDQLRKFQQEDLQTTMLQNEQTTRLIQNQRNQNNQERVEANDRSETNQNTNRNNSVEELLNQGKQYREFLNYRLAIRQFDKVLQIEPKNIEAKKNLMNTLYEMKYCNSSLTLQKNILEQDPQNFDAVLQYGVILYDQQKYGQSIDYISQKLDSFSGQTQKKELLKLLCNNYIENTQVQLAINTLNQLKSNYGENLFYFQGLGTKCCLLRNRFPEAQQYLDRANQIVNNDSESAIIQIQIFEKQAQYSKCLDQIEQQLRRYRKNKYKEKLLKLKIFLLYEQQQFQLVIYCCQLFLENYQDDIDVWYIFGQCLLEIKLYLMAIYFFDKVLRQNQNHCQAINAKIQAQENLRSEKTNLLSKSSIRYVRIRQSSLIQSHDLQRTYCKNLQQDYQNFLLHKAGTIFVENQYPFTVNFLDDCINNFPFDEVLKILKVKYYLNTAVADFKILAFELLDSIIKQNPYNFEAKNLLDQINFLRP